MSTNPPGHAPHAYPTSTHPDYVETGAPVVERPWLFSSHISWGAIIAGVVVAIAIGAMLNLLGIGVGGSTIDATNKATPSASSLGIGAGVWVLVANLIGLFIGGYVAARLSGSHDRGEGTLHGVAMWGAVVIVSAIILGSTVGSITSTVTSGVSSAIGSIGSGLGSLGGAAGQQAANRTDTGTMQSMTQSMVQRAQNALNTGGDPASMSADQRNAEITQILTRRVTDGQLSDGDRNRLSQLVAAQYGISQDEAQARVQQLEQQTQQMMAQAEQQARQAADTAAHSASIGAYLGFATLLLGAIVSMLGARMGTRPAVGTVRR